MVTFLPLHEVTKNPLIKSAYSQFIMACLSQPCPSDAESSCYSTLFRDIAKKQPNTTPYVFLFGNDIIGLTSLFCSKNSDDNNKSPHEITYTSTVHPQHRGNGWGKILLLEQYKHAQNIGADQICVHISPQNSGSWGRYRRLSNAGLARETHYQFTANGHEVDLLLYSIPTSSSEEAISYALGLSHREKSPRLGL